MKTILTVFLNLIQNSDFGLALFLICVYIFLNGEFKYPRK